MIFGEKKTFAIEAYLTQGNKYVFVNYCFWIKNVKIGNLIESTLINSIYDLINLVFSFKGKRQNYYCINNAEYIRITEYLISQYVKDMNNFVLNIASFHDECLQGYYIFLLEEKGFDLILVKNCIDNMFTHVKIPKNNIYNYFKAFKNWIDDATVLVLKDYLDNLENQSLDKNS